MTEDNRKKSFEWSGEHGLDPRSKANIRANGKGIPNGIDWDALISKGLDKKPASNQTSLGFINDQQKNRGKK